jgi:hypothetical protein
MHPESSDQDLRHEQGHFDLTQRCAQHLDVALERVTQRGASAGDATRALQREAARLYREASAACQELQNRYDRETRHGHKPRAQARWAERIAAELASGVSGNERELAAR